MIDVEVLEGETRPPTIEHFLKWTIQAIKLITQQIGRKTWRHAQYSWFVNNDNDNKY